MTTSPHDEPTQATERRLDPLAEPLQPAGPTRAELVALASACGLPRASLFWPVAPSSSIPSSIDGEPEPELLQDPLAPLVRDAEAELARRGVTRDVAAAILAPARALLAAGTPRALGGSLGLLASASEARLFALPQVVEARAWVSGRYRVSPLVPLVEGEHNGSIAERRLAASVGSGRARLDLPTVLALAREGRIELMLAASDAHAFGTFDAAGRVEVHATRRPDDEELVDLAVAYALGHGAEVHVVPRERIPGGGMVAALVRA